MRTASTKVGTYSLRHGTEGDRHDPYSYSEYEFLPADETKPKLILHGGLMEWLKVGDEKRLEEKWESLVAVFKQESHLFPHEVEDLVNRPQYSPMRGMKVTITLTVNDVRWVIRGLDYAYGKTKSRVIKMALNRVAHTIGAKACEAFKEHIMLNHDASIGPDSGSESFDCRACGWSESIRYY